MPALTATQNPAIDLTVIIPVYDARGHLEPLARSFLDLNGICCQIILADDSSVDGSREEIARLAALYPQVTGLYQPANLGAGHTRNLAWSHAQGRYCIFFDADDRLHGEVIAPALAAMDAEPDIDTAMFAYRYEREETATSAPMAFADQQSFDNILKESSMRAAPLEDVARLLRFTNYPWNKILRTARFRETGLRFGSTKVNNDILGHWYSLLFARRILVVGEVICTHIVHPRGQNLTNRFTAERLQMFDALAETRDMLATHPALQRRFGHHFWGLVNTLVIWARARIDPEIRLDFESRYRDLISGIDLEVFSQMQTVHAPQVATRFVKDLIGSE